MCNPETLETLGTQDKELEETKGAIKNVQSRDTGNIGHTGQRQTQEQKHNITQKTKKMSNTDPT
jgi:hypothetical protein